jgi:hypothetical protein
MTQPKDCAVYRDPSWHTCIRIEVDRKHTKFIPMSVSDIRVHSMPNPKFAEEFVPMDYDPKRAAERYLFTGEGINPQITPEARALLSAIAGPAFKRESMANDPPAPKSPNSTLKKEVAEMATEAKKDAAPAKRPAAKKAAAAPAASKKAAPAAKKAPAKKAAAESAGTRGRAPNIDGSAKIKVLVKENPKRAAAAERFALYKNGMTVDEYLVAGGKRADVNWDVAQGFIEVK